MQFAIAVAYTAAPDADASKKVLCVARARCLADAAVSPSVSFASASAR